ncbi:MAG TPA: hypothetical protein VMY37_11940 [Thermoguttaceae bacterium]|nr:hypothetical protein [Thermoguttaceae bacterium]
MSYDLYFWKQSSECTHSPEDVVEALNDKNTVPGILPISINEILEELRTEFPEIAENRTTDPAGPVQLIWDAPDGKSVFLLDWSEYHLCVEGHGVDGEIFNRIIDVMAKFECPLYDPQTNSRYEG